MKLITPIDINSELSADILIATFHKEHKPIIKEPYVIIGDTLWAAWNKQQHSIGLTDKSNILSEEILAIAPALTILNNKPLPKGTIISKGCCGKKSNS